MYSYNISDKEAEPSPLSWGVPLSLSLTDSCVVLNNGCFAVHNERCCCAFAQIPPGLVYQVPATRFGQSGEPVKMVALLPAIGLDVGLTHFALSRAVRESLISGISKKNFPNCCALIARFRARKQFPSDQ
jgi:hypothetical protein